MTKDHRNGSIAIGVLVSFHSLPPPPVYSIVVAERFYGWEAYFPESLLCIYFMATGLSNIYKGICDSKPGCQGRGWGYWQERSQIASELTQTTDHPCQLSWIHIFAVLVWTNDSSTEKTTQHGASLRRTIFFWVQSVHKVIYFQQSLILLASVFLAWYFIGYMYLQQTLLFPFPHSHPMRAK
jgi:hypothetical protein